MKSKRQNYEIETLHPNGYRDGVHTVTVTTTKSHLRNRYVKNVSGGGFGCSRDYETPSDLIAIASLMAGNGMHLIRMKAV